MEGSGHASGCTVEVVGESMGVLREGATQGVSEEIVFVSGGMLDGGAHWSETGRLRLSAKGGNQMGRKRGSG